MATIEDKNNNWVFISIAVIILIIGLVAGLVVNNGFSISGGNNKHSYFSVYPGENDTSFLLIKNNGSPKRNISILLNDEYECLIDKSELKKTTLLNINECVSIDTGNNFVGRVNGLDYVSLSWSNKSEDHELV